MEFDKNTEKLFREYEYGLKGKRKSGQEVRKGISRLK